ncbi:unnamed protein product [Fusarium equiseti]|uniref:Uncharacterized protein n=1 Tax=Fusarium equiseti TaxID=61235 RepID=A0A8J2J2A5_FUSEQ|nr:unnamed protein product [Fusarium equiseti]
MNGDDGGDIHVRQVKRALRAVVQIIHGNHTDKHYADADPRLLFFMVLIHEALGAPSSVKSSEPDVIHPKKMPFFSHYAIEREVSMLIAKEKYLYRVPNWLLLAVVADRMKSRVIKQLVGDELVLFCEAEQKGVPEGTRHMIKDSEWALMQELPLVDDQMLNNRLFCVERIFKALRLLSHQVLNMDQGILPNPNELEVYQDYRVATCERCYSIPSDDLHEKLLEARLWPLGPNSSYKGTLIGLIRKIKDMEQDLLHRARRDCNQLTHLSERLYDITRYMQT